MKQSRTTNILFMLPTLLAFVLVIIIPFFMGIYYSLTDWNGVSNVINFIGFENYKGMFAQPDFINSLKATVIYTVINIALVNFVGFSLALLATSNLRLRNVYRAGFFIPNLIGGIVLGYIWQFMFNNVIVEFAADAGITFLQKSMLSKSTTVIWAMSIVNTWQYGGYIMMIYVAGIQGIPADVMEAASVDGANYFTRLRRILIPMMANSFTICLFLTLTNSFKLFDQNLALLSAESNGRLKLLALDIYETFYGRTGWEGAGQAKAVIFTIIVAVLAVVQMQLTNKKEVQR